MLLRHLPGQETEARERDKSRCVGHDATSCVPGQTSCDGTGRLFRAPRAPAKVETATRPRGTPHFARRARLASRAEPTPTVGPSADLRRPAPRAPVATRPGAPPALGSANASPRPRRGQETAKASDEKRSDSSSGAISAATSAVAIVGRAGIDAYLGAGRERAHQRGRAAPTDVDQAGPGTGGAVRAGVERECDLSTRRRLCGHGAPIRVSLRSGFAGLVCRHLPGWHGVPDPVRVWGASPLAIVGLRSATTPQPPVDGDM